MKKLAALSRDLVIAEVEMLYHARMTAIRKPRCGIKEGGQRPVWAVRVIPHERRKAVVRCSSEVGVRQQRELTFTLPRNSASFCAAARRLGAQWMAAWGLRPMNSYPTGRIKRYLEEEKKRYLNEEEQERLDAIDLDALLKSLMLRANNCSTCVWL